MGHNLTSTAWIAALLLAAASSISPGRLACQVTPITPQEPPTLGELFRVDPATGAPTPLEHVQIKKLVGPIQRGGSQTVEFYIEGEASPVWFKAGEPQQFVIRLMSPGDRYDKELNEVEVQRHIRLMRLLVQKGKEHDERFLTNAILPLNVQSYGPLTPGLDPKKPDRVAQSFRLTPQSALPPGEYHIWIDGMHDLELNTSARFLPNTVNGEHWAFEIANR